MQKELQEQLRETLSGCSIPSERISSYCNILSFIDQNFIGKEALREEILKLPKCQTGIYGSGDLLRDILELLK